MSYKVCVANDCVLVGIQTRLDSAYYFYLYTAFWMFPEQQGSWTFIHKSEAIFTNTKVQMKDIPVIRLTIEFSSFQKPLRMSHKSKDW